MFNCWVFGTGFLLPLTGRPGGGAVVWNSLKLVSVRPEMVDFGSGQGLSDFETAGIAGYSEEFKRAKTQPWAERCRLWMGTG